MIIAYLTGIYARPSDTFIRGEVRELRRLGHSVHTFSIRRPDRPQAVEVLEEWERTEYVLASGARRLLASVLRMALRRPWRLARTVALAVRIGWPGLKGRLWPFAYLVEACYLAERLEALGVEHLHDHFAEGSAAVAMMASELSGIGWSMTVHGPHEFEVAPTLALTEKVGRARFTAAISDYARRHVLRWVRPRDWERVHVVRCGVDGRFLGSPHPLPNPGRRLVCVGRLDEEKNHRSLVRAAARLAEDGIEFELTLVGDGPLRGELERAIRAAGLEGRIRIAGWAAPDEVRTVLRESRALVLASVAEGLPVVIMEALALGRPVVATDVAAVSELVVTGETGWLVPLGDDRALVDAMRDALLAPDEELERLGAAGARVVTERHDAAAQARRLADLFEQSVQAP
jgi:colanic acid/amylovoran biosynthesis glycosyltransferase